MKAIIYQPAKTAMQSGRGNSKKWLVEFDQAAPRGQDPFMGWTSSADTLQQLKLSFTTREAAIAYCDKHGIDYLLKEPHKAKFRPKNYSENFSAYSRRGPGTDPMPRPK